MDGKPLIYMQGEDHAWIRCTTLLLHQSHANRWNFPLCMFRITPALFLPNGSTDGYGCRWWGWRTLPLPLQNRHSLICTLGHPITYNMAHIPPIIYRNASFVEVGGIRSGDNTCRVESSEGPSSKGWQADWGTLGV